MSRKRILFFFFAIAAHQVLPAATQPGPVEGVFKSVHSDQLQARLETSRGEEIAVSLGRGDAAIYEAGDPVRGELVRYGEGFRLQTVWPNDPSVRGTITNLGNQLRHNTSARGRKAFRGVGEFIPRFALYQEEGELFLSESLKGGYAVINFIFTRCKMPTMRPAATARTHELQKMAAEQGLDNLTLVSITLDPAYDTPGIFTAYAGDKGIKTDNFHFLGGPELIVEDLKKQLGVLAEPDEEEIIRHTMSTALVDPKGKIIYRIPGSMWAPEVFLRQIERDME